MRITADLTAIALGVGFVGIVGLLFFLVNAPFLPPPQLPRWLRRKR